MPDVIELTEYQKETLPKEAFPVEQGELLWRNFGSKVSVDFPSPKTDGNWVLESQGYVGFIPLSPEWGISLKPKVELSNLFRMLEYAYGLDIKFMEDLSSLESMTEFYESLARVLARRTMGRAKRGFYRSYVPQSEQLPYVRGSFDLTRRLVRPWEVRLHCDYQEHTADVTENQILAWTLRKIARSGACGPRVLPEVRRAYRSLQGLTSLEPFSPQDCVNRLYNRLNDDYEPLHALCRFFLAHTGPSLGTGEHQMLPFLIDMADLFERFVAQWLEAHLPEGYRIKAQEYVWIGDDKNLRFEIDLVLYDSSADAPLCVLDTKYKIKGRPETSDLEQIVAYAVSKDCANGFLIYPMRFPRMFDERVGDIRVRSLSFPLDGDLEQRGRQFLELLLTAVPQTTLMNRCAGPGADVKIVNMHGRPQ